MKRVAWIAFRLSVAPVRGSDRFADRGEALAVGQIDPFRPLQIDEMIQRCAIERMQLNRDAGGMVSGSDRKVGPTEMWGATDAKGEVGDQREMGHFLDSDCQDDRAPAGDFGSVIDG